MHYNKRYLRKIDRVVRPDGKVEIWVLMTLTEMGLVSNSTPQAVKAMLPCKCVIINSYFPPSKKHFSKG